MPSQKKKTMQRYLAFDIGFRNFAYSIVDVDTEGRWYLQFMENHDLMKDSCNEETPVEFWKRFYQFLRERSRFFETCHCCLIEKQMGFNGKVNYKAIQMGAHLMGYLIQNFPWIHVEEYAATQKTRIFQSTQSSWSKRKQWAIEFVKQLLLDTEDYVGYEWLNTFSKKDDICDTILMNLAYNIEKKNLTVDRK